MTTDRITLTRRNALAAAAGLAVSPQFAHAADEAAFAVATFSADVTVPIGHALMGGGIQPAKTVVDPLNAIGFILSGSTVGKPVVICTVDWCEIRNDAYARWREVLAEAAGTTPAPVLVTSLHQHEAPVVDLAAQRLLEKHKAAGSICDIAFHEVAVQRVGKAVAEARKHPRAVTRLGIGQAKVEGVASNRRWLDADGKPKFTRNSAMRDPAVREKPEGTVDPWLKTLSFWDGETPLLALHAYATHPMSYYGQGAVSADFVGLARRKRQADDPGVTQIYASGASGNVTAGKYNDGSPANRPVLMEKLHRAMTQAWAATKHHLLKTFAFGSTPLRLEPRNDAGFTLEDLEKRLASDPKPFGQCLAALGLSWRKRADAGAKLDIPVLDFGPAQLILLPGESFVEWQLLAQKLRPDSFVLTMGYGECAMGYIPTQVALDEKDGNLKDWCWVAPGADRAMTAALTEALVPMK